jgi:hypothetical protein
MKTKKFNVPSEAMIELLRTKNTLPADARIVGTGWDRVFDENGKPFARMVYLYVESAQFDSSEEPGL